MPLQAFKDGMIDQEVINEAVFRVLRVKFNLGLFEKQYVNPDEAAKWKGRAEHRKPALRAAQKSIVLLKNINHILPLRKNLKNIAVTGMDAVEARLGGYSGPGNHKITILAGIKNKVGINTEIQFAAGCGREDRRFVPILQKYFYFRQNQPGLKGDYFNNIHLSGKSVFSRFDGKVDFKWTLFPPFSGLDKDWFSARWTGKLRLTGSGSFRIGVEGNDGFRLFINGRLVTECRQKQSFHRDIVAGVVRPVTELKGFKRIHLQQGEIKKVSFEIGFEQLSMLDEKLQRVVEPGDFKIMIGSSCKDIRRRGILKVVE